MGKSVCANCGDKFIMPATAVPKRAKLGWCTGCWNQYDKCHIGTRRDGTEVWGTGRTAHHPFSSRPDYDKRS